MDLPKIWAWIILPSLFFLFPGFLHSCSASLLLYVLIIWNVWIIQLGKPLVSIVRSTWMHAPLPLDWMTMTIFHRPFTEWPPRKIFWFHHCNYPPYMKVSARRCHIDSMVVQPLHLIILIIISISLSLSHTHTHTHTITKWRFHPWLKIISSLVFMMYLKDSCLIHVFFPY